jgi:signal transduction histidine kinase/GAF domain-containing protein
MSLSDEERLHYEQALLELRTLQRVAEELSRSLDLEAVMGRLLDLTVEVARAMAGAIYLHEPERGSFRRVAVRALSDEVAPPALPLTDLLRSLSGPSFELPMTPDSPNSMVQAAWAIGIRRVVLLPLRGDEQLVGFVAVHLPEAAVLGSTLPTLEAIARQGAFATANARAHQIAERRALLADSLRVLSERALACSDDHELYRVILDGAVALTRNDRGLIARAVGDKMRVVAGIGADSDLVGNELPMTTPELVQALAHSAVQVYEDAPSQVEPASTIGMVIQAKGTRSFLISTMRHADRPQGMLFAASGEPRRYQGEEREALQIVAALAAEALERLRALERLAEEKRRLDVILEHIPVGVSVMGPGGELLNINRAAREFAASLALSENWREAIERLQLLDRDGKPIPPEEYSVACAFRGESPPPKEVTLVGPNGRRAHIVALAEPLRGSDGRVEAVVSCAQDVTSLRELADVKDHFLRVASHELRSPLTALRATTSLLEMDPAAVEDSGRRELLMSRIQRQVGRLTRLVEQLIDSVRLNATEPPLERTSIDLRAVCAEVVAALPDAARVKLEAPEPVAGSWDSPRLEQVLSNLLSNAARYSASETPIVVRLHRRENEAVLEVSDRGIGIPPEQIEQLFTPFFRASNAPGQSKGGLGLGLHIAHEIVRRHGGTLTVESMLGQGSTFTVRLPVDTSASAG